MSLRKLCVVLALGFAGCGEEKSRGLELARGAEDPQVPTAESVAGIAASGPSLDLRIAASPSIELSGEWLALKTSEDPAPGPGATSRPELKVLHLSARGDQVVWTQAGGPETVEPGLLEVAPARGALAVTQPITVLLGAAKIGRYRGVIRVSASRGVLQVTNRISLEEYLSSVVGSEMSASVAPLDALRSQAVAARTYALHAVQSRENRGQPVEFAPDESFQAYGGVEKEHPKVLQAVRETTGEVLTYRGRLFRAYFHASCGGHTSSGAEIFGEAPIEPLSGVECTDCVNAPRAQWTSTWSAVELSRALQSLEPRAGSPIQGIEAIEVAEREPAGRVRYVRIRHAGGSFELRATKLRALLSSKKEAPLRSTDFTIRMSEAGFVFEGKGWGHGVGLCQGGTRTRAEQMDYRVLLGSYFPGSILEKAY